MVAIACPHVRRTLPMLRYDAIRRSSARISGTGTPLSVSRSVGRTSGSTSAGGTTLVRGSGGASRNVMTTGHIVPLSGAPGLRNEEDSTERFAALDVAV